MRKRWLLLVPLACLGPTEITVLITTDVLCTTVTNTAITVGTVGTDSDGIESLDPSSVTDTCTKGRIGSIVIVPGRRPDDVVGVRIATGLGRDAATCKPPYGPGCIVARRAIKFVSHQNVPLAIVMHGICNGNSCDPNSTCDERGVCVPLVPNTPPIDASPPPDPACPLKGVDPTAAYPMFGYCPAHRNRTRFSAPATFNLTVGAGVFANAVNPPLVAADGTIFVEIAVSHRVQALTFVSGALQMKWLSNPIGTVSHLVSVIGAQGVLFVASTNTLAALDPETGLEKWTKQIGPVTGLALGAMENGNIVYATSDNKITGYTPGGALAFIANAPDAVGGAAPAQGAGGLLFVRSASRMLALDPTGAVIHSNASTGISNSVIALADGTLRAQDPPAKLIHVFDAQGALTKSIPASSGNPPMAIGDDGTMFIADATDSKLHARDRDGRDLWTVDGMHGAPLVDAAGVVYSCNYLTNYVEAIHPKTGAVMHSSFIGEACLASPAMTAEGRLVVVGISGTVRIAP